MHVVREGVHEEGRTGRGEMKEAGRGRAWHERGS